MDAAEDRERFDEILNQCGIPRAAGRTVFTTEQALSAAHEVGYPVLVRPSYVLGGQGMEIAYNDRNIIEFMRIINQVEQEHPILVDKYLMGREVEVDGVFDGEELLIPGIMEHIERAGVHSGDSHFRLSPHPHRGQAQADHPQVYLPALQGPGVIGLVNIQFVIYEEDETFEAVWLDFNEVPQDTITMNALISTAFEELEEAVYGPANEWAASEHSYMRENDLYAAITFYPDGTFSMVANLYEGLGNVYGTYTVLDDRLSCVVDSRDFGGFVGDDVQEFEMIFAGDNLQYSGSQIGTCVDGSIYTPS